MQAFFLSFYLGNFSYRSCVVSLLFYFIKGVCLTHPVLAWFLSGVFLLHIPCWFHFYRGSFSYTSRAGFVFIWGVSLTHLMLVSFLPGEFLLHIPCWLRFYLGSFSYTSRAGIILMRGVSLIHPMLTLFMWVVSLTHLLLPSFLCGEFVLHILCFLSFIRGISLTHPALDSIVCGKFLLHIPCWLFLCGEFLLHIPCYLHFYAVSFSYTSGAVLVSMQGISLTHPKLASFFFFFFFFFGSGEFLLQIPRKFLLHMLCWLNV